MKSKFYLIFSLITFALLSTDFLLSTPGGYFTRMIILTGTIVLACISFLSFIISARSANNENPNKFVRGVMGGTFLKFFLCVLAVGVLLFITKKQLHKPDLFLLMFVYLIYTIVETAMLFNLSRQKK